MAITQMYETTLTDTETTISFSYIVLPSRSLPKTDYSESELLVALGLKDPIYIPSDLIPIMLTILLLAGDSDKVISHYNSMFTDDDCLNVPLEVFKSKAHRFAQHLAFSRVVPFEQSPLELDSIANLVTNASGLGVGAYVGFVTVGVSPLLFLTVPAGMILCGAASGVAKALEEGLRRRLMSLLEGKWQKTGASDTQKEKTQAASQSKKSEKSSKTEDKEYDKKEKAKVQYQTRE